MLYADDTVCVKASKEKSIETLMNCVVEIAILWMNANKLTFNVEKSSAFVIDPGAKAVTEKTKIV